MSADGPRAEDGAPPGSLVPVGGRTGYPIRTGRAALQVWLLPGRRQRRG